MSGTDGLDLSEAEKKKWYKCISAVDLLLNWAQLPQGCCQELQENKLSNTEHDLNVTWEHEEPASWSSHRAAGEVF